jgi:hypothetical protein
MSQGIKRKRVTYGHSLPEEHDVRERLVRTVIESE